MTSARFRQVITQVFLRPVYTPVYVMHSKQQVSHVYFEIWTTEVGIGWKVTHLSILRFFFYYYCIPLVCFLSAPCNFWLIFKHFHTKKSAFSAACHIQNYIGIGNFKGQFLKNTFQRNRFSLIHKWSYLKKMEYELDFGRKLKLKVYSLL